MAGGMRLCLEKAAHGFMFSAVWSLFFFFLKCSCTHTVARWPLLVSTVPLTVVPCECSGGVGQMSSVAAHCLLSYLGCCEENIFATNKDQIFYEG